MNKLNLQTKEFSESEFCQTFHNVLDSAWDRMLLLEAKSVIVWPQSGQNTKNLKHRSIFFFINNYLKFVHVMEKVSLTPTNPRRNITPLCSSSALWSYYGIFLLIFWLYGLQLYCFGSDSHYSQTQQAALCSKIKKILPINLYTTCPAPNRRGTQS